VRGDEDPGPGRASSILNAEGEAHRRPGNLIQPGRKPTIRVETNLLRIFA
jgi:hypothetical protein